MKKSEITEGDYTYYDVVDGAIIGTDATVASEIPHHSIAISSPARVIHKHFDDKIIQLFERLQWRNMPIEEIDKLIPIFTNADIAEMRQMCKRQFWESTVN